MLIDDINKAINEYKDKISLEMFSLRYKHEITEITKNIENEKLRKIVTSICSDIYIYKHNLDIVGTKDVYTDKDDLINNYIMILTSKYDTLMNAYNSMFKNIESISSQRLSSNDIIYLKKLSEFATSHIKLELIDKFMNSVNVYITYIFKNGNDQQISKAKDISNKYDTFSNNIMKSINKLVSVIDDIAHIN